MNKDPSPQLVIAEDSHLRSLFKAVTYRFFGFIVTVFVGFVVTRSTATALSLGALDTLLKIFAYYFHERIWHHLPFGRRKIQPPEYEI